MHLHKSDKEMQMHILINPSCELQGKRINTWDEGWGWWQYRILSSIFYISAQIKPPIWEFFFPLIRKQGIFKWQSFTACKHSPSWASTEDWARSHDLTTNFGHALLLLKAQVQESQHYLSTTVFIELKAYTCRDTLGREWVEKHKTSTGQQCKKQCREKKN